MNEILDILYDYSKKNKFMDIKEIMHLFNIIKKQLELDDYVRHIKDSTINPLQTNYPTEKEILMTYDKLTKIIKVNKYAIERNNDYVRAILTKQHISEYEIYLICNSFLIHMIRHELEHANQMKKSLSNDNNFESQLLKICMYPHNQVCNLPFLKMYLSINKNPINNEMIKSNKIHALYQDCSPEERLANIYSMQYIIDILKSLNDIDHTFNIMNECFLDYQLKGYNEQSLSPTNMFLEDYKDLVPSGLLNEQFYSIKEESIKTSLDNRLLLGLPITEEEYKTKKLSLK